MAVIDPNVAVRKEYQMRSSKDFRIEWFSGTGAGGQHRNKHQNSCRVVHIPTGLKQEAQCRSRQNSQQEAMTRLIWQLDHLTNSESNATIAINRKQKVGSGMRGDKIRTYRFQDNLVKDHNSGKQAPCDRVMNGNFELLW